MKSEYRILTNGKYFKIEFKLNDNWQMLSSIYDTLEDATDIMNRLIAQDDKDKGPWMPIVDAQDFMKTAEKAFKKHKGAMDKLK